MLHLSIKISLIIYTIRKYTDAKAKIVSHNVKHAEKTLFKVIAIDKNDKNTICIF